MDALRLRFLAGINTRVLPETTDPGFEFRYIDIGSVGRGHLVAEPEPVVFEHAPSRARRVIRAGDCLVSTVRTYLRAVLPVRAELDGTIASTGFAVLTPGPRLDPRFLGWVAQSDPFIEEVVARSAGVSYPAINPLEIGNLEVPTPPIDRQRTIADYLDTETARIDALIGRKEGLTTALSDRLRVLARVITTEAERTAPLRRAVRLVKTGTTPPASEFDALKGDEVAWYSPSDVGEWLEMKKPSRGLGGRSLTEGWVPKFPADSTVIVGIGATAGKVGHLLAAGSGNQQMTCLAAGPEAHPRFLSWQLFARTDEIRETAPYTTLPIINNDFLRSFELHLPGLEVQAQAASRLDELARSTEIAVSAIRKQLDRLDEHRQALITAAVTGELDIPGVGAA